MRKIIFGGLLLASALMMGSFAEEARAQSNSGFKCCRQLSVLGYGRGRVRILIKGLTKVFSLGWTKYDDLYSDAKFKNDGSLFCRLT
jgi:hypothetical protein